jgi:type II secretion system protein I
MFTVRTRAFTFIEVMVALAITSIALVGLLKLHLLSLRLAVTAQTEVEAIMLAQEKIAEILSAGYPEVTTLAGTVERNHSRFNWRTQVSNSDLSAEGAMQGVKGLRTVLVDVSWPQGASQKHLQMATYVADRNLK